MGDEDRVVKTKSADAEPESASILLMMRDAMPNLFVGKIEAAGDAFNVCCLNLASKGVESAPDKSTQDFCAIVLTGFGEWFVVEFERV